MFKKYSYLFKLVCFIGIFYVFAFSFLDSWKGTMNNGDTSGYYLHTVSFLMYHDVGDYSKTLDAFFSEYPSQRSILDDPFWMKESAIGKKFIKYSLGVAVMETPAFILGHIVALIHPGYKANGFSSPYIFAINFIQIFYLLMGLYLLGLVLDKYFSSRIVIWTLISLALGTNIFIQTTYLTIAHVFLFFAFSWLIFLSNRFYKVPSVGRAIMIGIVLGLIALIRVPEITAFLIPLFWGVYDTKSAMTRSQFIASNFRYYLLAGSLTMVVFSPQLWYWYYVSGELWINPYQGEGFNFLEPHIWKGWFSYQNGWLVYTPIMIFSLIGLLVIYKKAKPALLPLILFVGINTYIHYSYYVWNYFPGMGSRPMIESYPLLAFSFASFISLVFKNRITRILSTLLIVGLVLLNLLQSWQFRQGIIWTARANEAFYWEQFGNLKPTKQALRAFDSNEFQPDESNIEKVTEIYFNDFEQDNYQNTTQEVHFSGSNSLKISEEFPDTVRKFSFAEVGIQPGDYIKATAYAYRLEKVSASSRDDLESLVLRIFDEHGTEIKWTNIKLANHIGNEENLIGHFNTLNTWGEASYFVKVPTQSQEDWSMDILLWNPKKLKLLIDDVKVELYRRR